MLANEQARRIDAEPGWYCVRRWYYAPNNFRVVENTGGGVIVDSTGNVWAEDDRDEWYGPLESPFKRDGL